MIFKTIKERRKFIDNYREWEQFHTIPELALTIYRTELSTGAIIFATEYMYKDYEGNLQNNVIYSLVMSENDIFPNSRYYSYFNPTGCGITTLMEYLKRHPECEVPDNA